MQYKIYAYRITDVHGNTWTDVISEPNKTVHVYGILDELGQSLHFESEAYHLWKWTSDNNLTLEADTMLITLPFK